MKRLTKSQYEAVAKALAKNIAFAPSSEWKSGMYRMRSNLIELFEDTDKEFKTDEFTALTEVKHYLKDGRPAPHGRVKEAR